MIFRAPTLRPGMRTLSGARVYLDFYCFKLAATLVRGGQASELGPSINDLGAAVEAVHDVEQRRDG